VGKIISLEVASTVLTGKRTFVEAFLLGSTVAVVMALITAGRVVVPSVVITIGTVLALRSVHGLAIDRRPFHVFLLLHCRMIVELALIDVHCLERFCVVCLLVL
jgi:hypothetical protein